MRQVESGNLDCAARFEAQLDAAPAAAVTAAALQHLQQAAVPQDALDLGFARAHADRLLTVQHRYRRVS